MILSGALARSREATYGSRDCLRLASILVCQQRSSAVDDVLVKLGLKTSAKTSAETGKTNSSVDEALEHLSCLLVGEKSVRRLNPVSVMCHFLGFVRLTR